ncbi:protein BatD [Candidatus Gracilibacteria bacterium]|nr:protein BatD [Candidatus Gracilibacteria bacterium]NUJ99104.1 protein BatD [Candidatus Gracilibacteria bacterium]
MKKVLIAFIASIICITNIFAGSELKINIDKKELNIGDSFTLSFSLDSNGNKLNIKKIHIDGVEKFVKKGQSQSEQIVMINGEMKAKINYDISFEALSEGDYTIGPVKLETESGSISSDTLNIHIGKGQKKGLIQTQKDTNIFNDVKEVEAGYGFSEIFIFLLFLSIFFVGFYFVLRYFLSQEDKKIPEQKKEKIEEKEDKNLFWKNKILELRTKKSSFSREEFYTLLSLLLREYFEKVFLISGASKMTLKEIKKQLMSKKEEEILYIFEDVYYTLFDEKENDSQEKREKLLKKFEKISIY